MINVGIYIYDGVEILDFTGPYSAFTSVNKLSREKKFNLSLLSITKELISTQNGITVKADFCLEDVNNIDILVIPGGSEARNETAHTQICDYMIKYHNEFQYILSVCTGALIIARTGLLRGGNVVTHKNAYTLLREIDQSLTIYSDRNVIRNKNIIMTAGVLTGIEGALKIIEEVCGNSIMQKVSDNLYYNSIKDKVSY